MINTRSAGRITQWFAVFCAGGLAGCTVTQPANVEVSPVLHWTINESGGTREVVERFKPCVVRQGKPFVLDFGFDDSFQNPVGYDEWREENIFKGLRAHLTITVSNGFVLISGRCEWDEHLGVVASYQEGEQALYAQMLRNFSTRFYGSTPIGRKLLIGAGEGANEDVSLGLTIRETTEPQKEFTKESVDD